jgi:hypothetical protein
MTLFVGLLLALWTLTVEHAMWRDEVQAWLITRASHSLGDLLKILEHEAHPLLWYLVIWPTSALSSNPAWMKIPHFLIVTATLGFLWSAVFKSTPERIVGSLGYFLTFGYAVMARPYMMGLLFTLIALRESRRSLPSWLFVLMLVLMANTHLFFFALAAGFGASSAMHGRRLIRWARRAPWRVGLQGAFLALGLALAVQQIIPASDLRNLGYLHAAHGKPVNEILEHAVLPFIDFDALTGLPLLLVPLGVLGAAALASADVFAFGAVAIGSLLVLQNRIYSGGMQHYGVVFIALWTTLLMARARRAPSADRAQYSRASYDDVYVKPCFMRANGGRNRGGFDAVVYALFVWARGGSVDRGLFWASGRFAVAARLLDQSSFGVFGRKAGLCRQSKSFRYLCRHAGARAAAG